jgi:hypothetical protein
MAYLSGNVVQFNVQFTNTSTGAPVDPGVVTFSYTVNGGANQDQITYGAATVPAIGVIARISTGVYQTWISTTGLLGTVVGQWVATGSNAAAVDDIIVIGSGPGSGNTFGDIIEKVYRRVMGGQRERTVTINQTGGIGSSDSVVTLSGPQTIGVSPGMILATDLELILVLTWNSSTLQASIERGYLGSTQAAHPNGNLCYINPKYSRYDVGVAINDDIRSMSSPANGLYRVGVTQITYNPVLAGYDLGGISDNFNDILNVRYAIVGPSQNIPAIKRWSVHRNSPDAAFPSGNAIVIYDGGYPGLPMFVTYTAPFIPLVNLTDSLLNTPAINDIAPPYNGYGTSTTVENIPPTATDIPALGAEIDLTLPREISRNFLESQPDARKALEVVAGAVAGSVNALITRRADRMSEEADRLTRQYSRSRGW